MQGELFTADVVRFPIDSRAYLVRRIARRLFELKADKAASGKLWAETCLIVKAGEKTEAQGHDAMQAFAAAVTDEMRRIMIHDHRRTA